MKEKGACKETQKLKKYESLNCVFYVKFGLALDFNTFSGRKSFG
jgi:hypothetical protein